MPPSTARRSTRLSARPHQAPVPLPPPRKKRTATAVGHARRGGQTDTAAPSEDEDDKDSSSPAPSRDEDDEDSGTPLPNKSEAETRAWVVTEPVMHLVHSSLGTGWKMEPARQMCIRFDVINPLRQFKRGARWDENEDIPFPQYDPSPEQDDDVVEDDDKDGGLMQYEPVLPPQCVPPADLTSTVIHSGGMPLAASMPGRFPLRLRTF